MKIVKIVIVKKHDSKQIYLNSKHSIVQDNWTLVHKGTYQYKMMEILYENCWHK